MTHYDIDQGDVEDPTEFEGLVQETSTTTTRPFKARNPNEGSTTLLYIFLAVAAATFLASLSLPSEELTVDLPLVLEAENAIDILEELIVTDAPTGTLAPTLHL